MNKYINADELKKALYHLADWDVTESKYVSLPFIFRAINKEPAADVVEVKHGEWIELPNGWDGIDEYLRFECSECHREVFNNFPYCPYCNADMRGETE